MFTGVVLNSLGQKAFVTKKYRNEKMEFILFNFY